MSEPPWPSCEANGGAATPEGTVEVHAHDRAPAFILHVQGLVDESRSRTTGGEFGVALRHGAIHLGAAIVRPGASAGVIHQYVQAAQRGMHLREGGVDGGAIGDIAGQREVLCGVWQQSHRGGGIFLAQV